MEEKLEKVILKKWNKTGQTNWLRNLGKTWQQWRQGMQGGAYAICILIQTPMHANSDTEA